MVDDWQSSSTAQKSLKPQKTKYVKTVDMSKHKKISSPDLVIGLFEQ